MIPERDRLDAIMGDKYCRYSQLNQPMPKLPAQMLSGGGIEGGKRFVEQEQPRPADQRTRKRHALLLPARQLLWVAVLKTGQSEQCRNLLDALPPLRWCDLCKAISDVLRDTQMREERVILEEIADLTALRRQKNPAPGVEPDFVAEADHAAI